MTEFLPTTFPTDYNSAFFSRPWVQDALGVPVNFTLSSNTVVNLFFGATGDPMRRTAADLEYLLGAGVGVALVYGDRDYRCNWLGAENVSLVMDHPGAAAFRAAGYAPIVTNATYEGGVVRQHVNLSFSRVFQAGHSVAAYQPETVFRIFQRAMAGKDVASGAVDVRARAGEGSDYSSHGPASSFDIKTEPPATRRAPVCLVMDASITCAANQLDALRDGSAVTQDFVVVSPAPILDAAASGSGSGSGDETGDSAARENAASVATAASLALGVASVGLFIGLVL